MLNQASSLLGQTSFTPAQVIYGAADILPPVTTPVQAETTALLAAMTVQPDAARRTLIDNTIVSLKSGGLWTTFDLLYVIAAHDGQAGRVNWVNPAQVLTVNGTTPFTTDRGYAGDATTSWLGTGINISALTKFQQDNACAGVWQQTAAGTGSMLGATGGTGVNITPRIGSGFITSRLNCSTAFTGTINSASGAGHAAITRASSVGYDQYKNGGFYETTAVASIARVASEACFLRLTTFYASVGQIIAAGHWGSSLTGAQITTLNNILNSYMVRVGAAALQAETTALVAAMTITPSAARQALIDDMIVSLKNAGLWTTFDLFYIIAAHDAQAARVNWVNPAQVLTVNGTTPFTTDRGYAGDGTTGYLGSGINHSALPKLVQDNAAIGVWGQNDVASAALLGTPTTNRATITAKSGAVGSTRLNCITATTFSAAVANGHVVATRTVAANYDRYKNGTLIDNAVQASVARVAEEIQLLRAQAAFSAPGAIVAAAHYGSSLTGAQITTLYNILQTYMTAVGA